MTQIAFETSELIKRCSCIDMLTALPDATNDLTLACHEQRAGAATDCIGRFLDSLSVPMGGDLAPNLGGTKIFFRGPISGKSAIFRVKISDDLFLVIDLVLRIFPFFSHIFRMFTMLNVVYDTIFHSVHAFTHIRQHYFSKYWGGTNAWAVPPSQILGGPSPPSSTP